MNLSRFARYENMFRSFKKGRFRSTFTKNVMYSKHVNDLYNEIVDLEIENQKLQAKVDALMLEYCPEEMTETQIELWKNSQVPSK